MASASSQSLSSCEPDPRLSGRRFGWKVAVLTLVAAMAAISMLPHVSAATKTLVILGALCAAWQCYLQHTSLPSAWNGPLSAILVGLALTIVLKIPAHPANLRAQMVLSAILLYGIIMALSAQNTRRELQALASIALLLPFTLYARPQLLLAAFFLALIAMFRCGRRFGGFLQSGLLIFTP